MEMKQQSHENEYFSNYLILISFQNVSETYPKCPNQANRKFTLEILWLILRFPPFSVRKKNFSHFREAFPFSRRNPIFPINFRTWLLLTEIFEEFTAAQHRIHRCVDSLLGSYFKHHFVQRDSGREHIQRCQGCWVWAGSAHPSRNHFRSLSPSSPRAPWVLPLQYFTE